MKRKITTTAEFDALPMGSVVLDREGRVHHYESDTSEHPDSIWRGTDGGTYYGSYAIVRDRAPFVALYVSEESK